MNNGVAILRGDVREIALGLAAESFDGCLCDPPYGLSFMGKKWDYDVPSVETWQAVLGALKPGAHLLAFAGTRTQHRMAVRIEDAGFEIRDMIAWVYGSGFPKSLDVSKAIDKAAGIEGTFGAPKSAAHAGWIERGRMRGDEGHEGYQRPWMADAEAVDKNARQYIGGTDAARQWQGWGTALKPALEPITVARKPLRGTVAANVLAFGTGALNVDGCRVGTRTHNESGWSKSGSKASENRSMSGANYEREPKDELGLGRWPANLIHDGSEGVLELAGESARFFYCAKASRSEREAGLREAGLREVSASERTNRAEGSPGLVMEGGKANPYAGNTGNKDPARNHHPTVKPIALAEYLARLILPPKRDTPRRLLVPFSGSGSEIIGALRAGWDEVVGIEFSPEYAEIAEARIAHWTAGHQDLAL